MDNYDIKIYNNNRDTFFDESMINLSDTYDEEYIKDIVEDYEFNVNTRDFCNKMEKLENELKEFCEKMEKEGYDYIYPLKEECIENILDNDINIKRDGEDYKVIK